jgi:hypothetical protein
VACASGWGVPGEEDSEAELLFYHRLASKLDRAMVPLAGTVWKVQRYTMPYYCVICPCVNSENHANLVADVAFRLHAAASKVRGGLAFRRGYLLDGLWICLQGSSCAVA